MFKYRGVNFIKTVYRPYVPLMSSLFFVGFSRQVSWKKFIGFDYKLMDALVIEGVYYYPDYHLLTFAQKAVKHILKSPQNFLHLKRETLRREKLVLVGGKKNGWRALFAPYLDYLPTLAIYHICDDFIEESLRSELAKHISTTEASELISQLNLPVKLNLDQEMKSWFLKTEDIDGFIKKYSWSFSRYGQHRLFTRSEAREFLKSLQKEKKLLGADRGRYLAQKAVRKAKAILGSKAYYVDVMQFFVYYRTHRTDILNKTFFSYHDYLLAAAKKLKISYEELVCCSYEELVTGQIPSRAVLQLRKKEAVICFSHGQIKIIAGEKIDYFKKLCLDKKSSGVVKGRTAYPGIISGFVKVIK